MSYTDLKIGNITLLRRLGTGGMGAVYAGFDEKLHREVAVKAVRHDRLGVETRVRLLREARALSLLDHPNVCRIYDYVEGDKSDYLILELVRGRELPEALEAGLGKREKLAIAAQIAHALAAAHAAGVVHRDLKPGNVMLTESGTVKVLDFGLARFQQPRQGDFRTDELRLSELEAASETPTVAVKAGPPEPAVLGTVRYMSPEQARGGRVTTASDVYSLGLMLQELFTPQAPYPSDLPYHRVYSRARTGDTLPVRGVEPRIAELIRRSKAADPADRLTAAEVAERLDRLRAAPRRRARGLAAAAVAALLLVAGATYTLEWQRHRSAAERERDLAVASHRQAETRAELLMAILGDAAPDAGDDERFDELLRRVLELQEQALGRGHPRVRESLRLAAGYYAERGERARAEALHRRALEPPER